jgi:DNA-binding NarL/FixJ family response regulator
MVSEHPGDYRPKWYELRATLEGAQSVAGVVQHKVVILYEHALLGEGIATYLRAQTGIEATLGSARDPDAVKSALALGPEVVIFESNDPFQQFDLSTLVPHAVLIDVSTVITRGSVLAPCVAGLEQILQAVRDSGSTATVPSQTRQVGTSSSPAR